jgi:hypothetical protein
MDVAEPLRGHRYVLWRYLYVAVDFGPLAVQAGPCPDGDIVREPLPDIPGDEVAGSSHTWVCRAM